MNILPAFNKKVSAIKISANKASGNYSITIGNINNFNSYPKNYYINQLSFTGYNTPTAIELIKKSGKKISQTPVFLKL